MIRGFQTYKDFLGSGERIATNILADRLKKLLASGIVEMRPDRGDGRRRNYRLTQKGIDLAPVLLELLIWGARHESTAMPCALAEQMEEHRDELLTEVRRRWRQGDARPLQVNGLWLWP